MSTASASVKDMAQAAVQTNKEHQYALKVYAERLEAELKTVDKLLATAEIEEEEPHVEVAGSILIPGAEKPVGLLSSTELTSEESPFHADATKRQRYLNLTEVHPMKPKELESLAEGVRIENHRIRACEAQMRGFPPFFNPREPPKALEQNTEGLDWERIAAKVTADASAIVERTAKECEIRWLGDRHPRFSHTQWSASEVQKAKMLVEDLVEGEIDWVDIARKLETNRTPLDVMRHAIPRQTHAWDSASDRRLLDTVKIYGVENWALVARNVSEHATAASCQKRFQRTLDPSIKRGSWSPEEDAQLRMAVKLYGHAWIEVASVVPGRTNEQCRDRWSERLNPNVTKGKWSADEDEKLLAAVEAIGQGLWKEISERVGTGRTDNMCRYRYETLKKQADAASTPGADGSDVDSAPTAPKAKGRSRKGKNKAVPEESVDGADTEQAGDATPAIDADTAVKPRPRPRKKVSVAQDKSIEVNASAGPSNAPAEQDALPKPTKPLPRARLVKKIAPKALGKTDPATASAEPEVVPPPPKRRSGRTRTRPTEEPDQTSASEAVQSEPRGEEEEEEEEERTVVMSVKRKRKGKGKQNAVAPVEIFGPSKGAHGKKRKRAAAGGTSPTKKRRISTRGAAPQQQSEDDLESEDDGVDHGKPSTSSVSKLTEGAHDNEGEGDEGGSHSTSPAPEDTGGTEASTSTKKTAAKSRRPQKEPATPFRRQPARAARKR